MQRNFLRRHLLPIAAYSLITLVVTFPLALHLGTRIAGNGDAPWFLWQLWWFKHAIIDLARTPLSTDLIFYPAREVAINWQTPINELIFLPLHLAAGTVVYYNLLILGSFVLSGYFTYLLVLKILKQPYLAFVAGVIFAFNAYHGIRALNHLSLATTEWMPLALLLLLGAWQKPGAGRGLAAGTGLALVMLSSPYYAAYFVFPVFVCFAAYLVLSRRFALLRRPGVGRAAAAMLATSCAAVVPFYLDYLTSSPELKQAAMAAAQAVSVYAADVVSWVAPARDNPLWGRITAGLYSRFTPGYLTESTLFFGFLPPLLALWALVRSKKHPRQLLFWLLLAGLAWLLSFGPDLNAWGDQVLGWMPYRLFMALPGAYAFRAPARLGITAILAATVAGMYVLKRWMILRPRWPWRGLLAAWTAILLVDLSVGFPFPTSSTAIPPVYAKVAETPGDFAILELPSGELFLQDVSWYMYYQTFHQKRLISGYLGRRAESLVNQTAALPFANRFFVDDYGSYFAGEWDKLVRWPEPAAGGQPEWPDDVLNAGGLLSDLNIRYVVLHKDLAQHGFAEPAAVLLNHAFGPPVYSDATALLFETGESALASRNAPAFAYDVPADYTPTGSPPSLRYRLDARELSFDGLTAQVAAFDLPFGGEWEIDGILDGEGVPSLSVLVDGGDAGPATAPLFDNAHAFSHRVALAAGRHTLQVQRVSTGAPAGDRGIAAVDFHARLEKLDMPAGQREASDFLNKDGKHLRLLNAGILSDPGSAAHGARYLYTAWQEFDRQNDITAQPCLLQFTHITAADGRMVAQADHSLGESAIVPGSAENGTGGGQVIDFVKLPDDTAGQPDAVVRIGLWCPETKDYYWVEQLAGSDDPGNLVLGTVRDLEMTAGR